MKISFFEEFPTKRSFVNLKLIDFPTKVYVAARNLKEFYKIKKELMSRSMYVQEVAYWPVLKKEEGYWFSAFADTEAIKRIINELEKNDKPLTLLWDAELPFLNRKLMLTNLKSFFKNKKLITNFLKNAHKHKIKLAVAECCVKYSFINKLFEFAAIKFGKGIKHEKILMVYSSLMRDKPIKKQIEGLKQVYRNFHLGIGVIAKGVLKTEPLMDDEHLVRDLKAAKSAGIKEVTIYRLGGINKRNIRKIKKFI